MMPKKAQVGQDRGARAVRIADLAAKATMAGLGLRALAAIRGSGSPTVPDGLASADADPTDGVRRLDQVPERDGLVGPRSAPRQRATLRWLTAWSAASATAAAAARARGDAPAQAFWHSLSLPGAGHALSPKSRLRALGAATTWAGSYYAWPTTGNIIAPIATLAGVASAAARRARSTDAAPSTVAAVAVPAAVTGIAAATAVGRRRNAAQQLAKARERNARIVVRTIGPHSQDTSVGEWSPRDLRHLRHHFDIALQPVDRFDGFVTIDQVRDAGWRYQLAFPMWMFGLTGNNNTPAFSGYLAEAQRNLGKKHEHRRVWTYWSYENLWGHLRWNPEPLHHENIMLTGYLLLALTSHREQTGDTTFEEPGSLTFRWSKRTSWEYDIHRVAEAVAANFRKCSGGTGTYVCEPHWLYMICNIFGATGLQMYDRLYGTSHFEQIREEFLAAMQTEFTATDGGALAMRSSLTGFAPPLIARATTQDAVNAMFLNPTAPEMAARYWAQTRDEIISFDNDGALTLPLGPLDMIDPGDYRPRSGFVYTVTGLAASEHGDQEVVEGVLRRLERDFEFQEQGSAARMEGSPSMNNFLTMMRGNRKGGLQRFVTQGEDHSGPRLADCSYPDVLVARAAAVDNSLELVLYEGAGFGRQRLGLDQLTPGQTYKVLGGVADSVTASDEGTATIEVDLAGRTPVSVTASG